jgi:uncharacterized membrane protein HdeD (DUF308 family)
MSSSSDSVSRSGAGWGWLLVYGIVSLVLGLLAFAWPFAATFAATFVISVFLIAAGAVSLAAGFFSRGHEGRGYTLFFGAITLAVGLFMAFQPVAGAISLTLLIGFWLLARGVMEIGFGVRLRRHRWLMLALGAVDILLALFVILRLPYAAMTLPGFILGLSFLFGGLVAIMQALAHRSGAAAFAAPTEIAP